jgi:FG-GAP-like repeat
MRRGTSRRGRASALVAAATAGALITGMVAPVSASAAAAPTVTRITKVGGPSDVWRDYETHTAGLGLFAISPVVDPANVDGSLRLTTTASAGDAAELATNLGTGSYFTETAGQLLTGVTAASFAARVNTGASDAPSYDLRVSSCAGATLADPANTAGTASIDYGVLNQTQSVQVGVWQSWDAMAPAAVWTSSVNLSDGVHPIVPAGTHMPWSQVLSLCGTTTYARGLALALGPNDPSQDANVDSVILNGSEWNFAAATPQVVLTAPGPLFGAGPAVTFPGSITNPVTGANYPNVRVKVTVTGYSGLSAASLTLAYQSAWTSGVWTAVTLTDKPNHTVVGYLGGPTGTALAPGASVPTSLRVSVVGGTPTGTVGISADLQASADGGTSFPASRSTSTVSASVVALPAHDFTSDGHPDVLARTTNGNLYLYAGSKTGFLGSGLVGPGWGGYNALVAAGDWNGDGFPDLIARTTSGALDLLHGTGNGGFGAAVVIGSGWNGLTILSPGDWNGDGHPDLLAITSTGLLLLYPGTGSGFGTPTTVGNGWRGLTVITPGDWNGDGHPDLIARTSTGLLKLYPWTGTAFGAPRTIGNGWGGLTILGPGDWNVDGHPDLIAISSAGTMTLYPGTGSGFGTPSTIGTGWRGFTALV